MTDEELEHRLTAVENRAQSNTHRLDELGKLTDAVNGMNTNIKLTIQQLENTNKSLEIVTAQNKKQEDRLTALEKAPGTFGNKLWWAVLAALFGAVVSSLASMLNSASTIFTMDIYNKLRKNAGPTELVTVGKIGLLVCAVIALTIAPFLDSPAFGGIFNFIQEFQGFLSPGALCVFLFGFFVPKCPRIFGWLGIVINALLYGILKVWQPEMAFLNRMAVCFITVVVIGFIFTAVNAARGGQPIVLPDRGVVALQSSSRAKIFGWLVVAATVALYIIFW